MITPGQKQRLVELSNIILQSNQLMLDILNQQDEKTLSENKPVIDGVQNIISGVHKIINHFKK